MINMQGIKIVQMEYMDTLDGDESIEITTATRVDGGGPMGTKKTYRVKLNDVLELYAARRDNPNQVTAAQVGAFSQAQITTLLEGYLTANGTAVNADRLGGQTLLQVIDAARDGLVTRVEYDDDLTQLADAFVDAANLF